MMIQNKASTIEYLYIKRKMIKAGKCREYANAQKDNCQCVPKKKKDEKFVDSIASFYKAFQKSKLPKDGDNKKWVESVVKKPFPGKPDQDVWAALFQKYWYVILLTIL